MDQIFWSDVFKGCTKLEYNLVYFLFIVKFLKSRGRIGRNMTVDIKEIRFDNEILIEPDQK
jgi:hypothetical protein